jgi:hypothetical protein
MAIRRSVGVYACALILAVAMLAAEAAAEPVQVAMTVDANTTALYLFNEGTGATTACAVTGVPSATFYGANWVPGRQAYAASTDAGYVGISDNAALRPITAITVEAWVKLNYPEGYVVCKNGNYLLCLGETVTAYFAVSGWQSFSGTLPIPTGQWVHLAITYDSATQTAAIYINGVLDTKKTFTGLSSYTLDQGTLSLRLGQNDWASMGSEMDGKIDSFRISNIARAFVPLYPPSPEAAAKGNLVPNGDFEIGLTGWRGDGYGDINLVWETTGAAATGQKCLHSLSGANPKLGVYSRPIPAHPGRHYILSGRFKTNSSTTSPLFEIKGCGSGADIVSCFTPSTFTATTAWQQFSFPFTLSATFASPSLCVHIGYPSGSRQLYVDDVRLIATDGMNVLTLKDKISVGPQVWPVGNLYAYTPGTTTAATVTISNTDTVAHDVTVQPTITDWEEKSVAGIPSLGTFTVAPATAVTTTYGIDTSRRGTFRLGFDLTSEGQTWHQSAEAKYAVVVNMQNVGNPDTSIFGVNTHMENEPTAHLSREMQVLSKCGVKWVRAWWGWGMCENPLGTFSWTEYDRQYNTVTSGTGMRIMPILLRYKTSSAGFSEWSWSGPTPSGGIQQYPYTTALPEWEVWVGKVAQHYAGNIKAYEVWNEPTMGGGANGDQTPAQYAVLLNDTAPYTRPYDPNAKLIGFAGVDLTFMQQTLALGTASQMDAVSEHAYSQIWLPEKNYPLRISTGSPSVNSVMAAGGCPAGTPLWHTEQGIHVDGDGFKVKSVSETDVAQLLTRNYVTAAAQGSKRFFWFSVDDTPAFGYTIFFGDYVPRPRLGALAACASFLEGANFVKTYKPDSNTFAHMFQGTSTGVCVFWNTVTPMQLTLAINPSKLQAFDTMGNAIPIVGTTTSTIQVAMERPTYLQCNIADYGALDAAMSTAQAVNVPTVNIAMAPTVGGVRVTLTGASPVPVDGIIDLIAAASPTPKAWPAAQWFQGLAMGQSQSFTFVVPAKAGISQVRVRCGDRRTLETRVSYTAH